MPAMNSVISSGVVAAVGERVEDPPDGRAGALVLGARLRAEVDALEHERAQREHRAADLVALGDVALARGGLDQVVDERVDALRAGRAEDRDLVARQVALLEDAVADRVVDVVVDVGDPIDDADDLALERLGLLLAGVREDAVAHLVGQVQPLGDPQRLLVVAEAAAEALARARRRAPPRRRARTACGRCRGRGRSPRRDPRSSRSARATTRAIPVVSSVWVMRVR